MIRVVYRWTIDRPQAEAFVAAWWEATRYIQHAWPQAHGSFLLKSTLEADVYIAVARWDSIDAWKYSRDAAPVVPAEIMEAMTAAATGPASYEIFEEVLDWASHRTAAAHGFDLGPDSGRDFSHDPGRDPGLDPDHTGAVPRA